MGVWSRVIKSGVQEHVWWILWIHWTKEIIRSIRDLKDIVYFLSFLHTWSQSNLFPPISTLKVSWQKALIFVLKNQISASIIEISTLFVFNTISIILCYTACTFLIWFLLHTQVLSVRWRQKPLTSITLTTWFHDQSWHFFSFPVMHKSVGKVLRWKPWNPV